MAQSQPDLTSFCIDTVPREYFIFQLHPMEIAKQATLIENEFYRSVTPQELLGKYSLRSSLYQYDDIPNELN